MKLEIKSILNKLFIKHLFLFLSVLLTSCVSDSYQDLIITDTALSLNWNKAYDDDTPEKSIIGLQWALSYLGATLPRTQNGITQNDEDILIDLDKLGFDQNALQKLNVLHEVIKASDEYQTTNGIDLGRYVTLLLGASEHYYEITDVPEHLSTLLNKYTLKPERGYVNDSGVSFEHRIISFSEQNGLNQFFLSTEVDPINSEILEYETIEILANGQLRFGIFDVDGNRKNNAKPIHSNAGKPAKCMWCHESNIQRLTKEQDNFEGFIPFLEFKDILINFGDSYDDLKNALEDGVDFEQRQQHTLTELLYISFMEPSAERLSKEWEIPISEIENLLSGLTTHIHPEFPFLGNLYKRKDIAIHAPFNGLPVSSNVREESEIEVNYIN